ncbi:MAG TPA: TIR domain-containing protein [Nevskiaceae bacterium]|nr:TIR domain-containing protein [Nevskiaceae bacterium]
MATPTRYWAFLSYAHADEAWARWLHRALERYRLPARVRETAAGLPPRLYPVFRDRDELSTSPHLAQALIDAMAASESLVVLCSPAAARSRWVNEEIRQFKQMGRAHRIFLVIVDGEPGDADRECFPPALHQRIGPDGPTTRQEDEFVAADLRPGKDGRTDAKLKIIAGILGLRFDDLKQRDLAARQARTTLVAGLAVAVAAVTTGLAVLAVEARRSAELRRDQAEQLIGYMLGDLREKLLPLGKLDILGDVGDQAVQYFGSMPARELTEEELVARMKSSWQIGEVRIASGDLEGARRVLDQALGDARKRVQDRPDDAERLFQLGQIAFWRGEADFKRGRPEQALPYLQEYAEAASRVARLVPSAENRMEQAAAQTNIAVLLNQLGEPEQALPLLQKTEAELRGLLEDDPDREERLSLLRQILGWQAAALENLQRRDETREIRREIVRIMRALAQRSPDNWIWQTELAKELQHFALAGADPYAGGGEALAAIEEAVSRLRAAHQHDPANAVWQLHLAGAIRTHAGFFWKTGDSRAPALMQAALETTLDLLERHSDLQGGRKELGRCLQMVTAADRGGALPPTLRQRLLLLYRRNPAWFPLPPTEITTLCALGLGGEVLGAGPLGCPSPTATRPAS